VSKASTAGPTPIKIEIAAIESLTLDPANARKHSAKNLESIKNSLKEFGQQKPIVVGPDGTVIAGNGTLEAAKSIGWKNIIVARTDLTGKRAAAFAIADNRTGELADWDEKQLADTLRAIADDGASAATGFSADDFSALVERLKFDSMMMSGGNAFYDSMSTLDAVDAEMDAEDDDDIAEPSSDIPDAEPEGEIECPKCGHHFKR
jgi:ParB-like nuclease domain